MFKFGHIFDSLEYEDKRTCYCGYNFFNICAYEDGSMSLECRNCNRSFRIGGMSHLVAEHIRSTLKKKRGTI